jgi:hypothetical protein
MLIHRARERRLRARGNGLGIGSPEHRRKQKSQHAKKPFSVSSKSEGNVAHGTIFTQNRQHQ